MGLRLSKLKITGFKSFVDPTVIDLEDSNLFAICGPNGCGKSNIIDAVAWLLGESSPKYLRGESSTDVIFNGSSARKPIGQASVELVFDNSDATIGGEYANYAEISVKRVINRESDSSYFLNGARCRKRDVVDIFRGTGLGPRSYSIVGQNMISRMIEAKPEDLRSYLEEAAGISVYKDRRRETELRINQTEENLARINDVRVELDKQLNHLKNQANVAEKYKVLKQQERTLRAELLSVQWRELDSRMVEYTLQIQRESTALEARNSEISTVDREIEQLRHEQRGANDAFQEVQRKYYSIGNEITRIEQDVMHHQERQQQWENDLTQTEQDWQTVKGQMGETEDNLQQLEQEITELTPKLASATQESDALEMALSDAEEAVQDQQTSWDEFNQTIAKTTQTAQVEQTHIQHLEQRIESLEKRKNQLQQDHVRLNFTETNQDIELFTQKSHEMAEQLESCESELMNLREELASLQTAQQDANKHLDNVRSESQRLRGQQASLEALQQTALGQRDNPATPWLAKHNLASNPRLAQQIEVEKGWELALEKVLGYCLQAICVDDLSEVARQSSDFSSGNVCVFNGSQAAQAASNHTKGTLLLNKVKSKWPLQSLLSGVYIAESMEDAFAMADSLGADESVVTKDGLWVSRSWLKILRENNPAEGVFQREEELKSLAARIEHLQATQDELEETIATRTDTIRDVEQQRDQLQQRYNQMQAEAAQIKAQQNMRQERLVELKSQSERLVLEQEECIKQLDQAKTELNQARQLWQGALDELEEQNENREKMMRERDQARHELAALREKSHQKMEAIHELQIRLETSKSQKASQYQSISRLQTQIASLNDRKLTLQNELAAMPPMDSLKKTLTEALDKHVSAESDLNRARTAVESLNQENESLEERRQLIEKEINKTRTSLEALRLDWQSWKVKSESILEQIKETEFVLEEVLKALPDEITAEEWQTRLDQTVNRISRLGAINLVAIDEYATCSERKQYLDSQVEDLQSGLATLQEAIAKIDNETRELFKDTYEKVNERFKELFPTVFGGGKAYLELTSENLLEAGVTVMACPPGKRNSTIHLLSGGEKSLTAVALIFSIFHLNPAPFCLLDEVDAALDDANVLRFTRLVKLMSEKTQFLFISHNKITIEMGEHLIGVTMNEPGVSRLVSVDIEKAISLASS